MATIEKTVLFFKGLLKQSFFLFLNVIAKEFENVILDKGYFQLYRWYFNKDEVL